MANNKTAENNQQLDLVAQDKLLQEEQTALRLIDLRESAKQEAQNRESSKSDSETVENQEASETTTNTQNFREFDQLDEEETDTDSKKPDLKDIKSLASEQGKEMLKKQGMEIGMAMAKKFLLTPQGIAILLGLFLLIIIIIILIAMIVMAQQCYESYYLTGKYGVAADIWYNGLDQWLIKAVSGDCQ